MFHPIVVHFTISLLAVGIISDLLYFISHKDKFQQVARYILIAGAIAAIIAVLTGHTDAGKLEIPQNIQTLLSRHETSGEITLALSLILVVFRLVMFKFANPHKILRGVYYLLALFTLILLFRTGFLGGELVYKYGVGVQAPQQKDQAPPQKPSFTTPPSNP